MHYRPVRLSLLYAVTAVFPARAAYLPAPPPGPARASASAKVITLTNSAITGAWSLAGGRLHAPKVTDRWLGRALQLPGEAFTIVLPDGKALPASRMAISGPARTMPLKANPKASRLAERYSGRQVVLQLRDASTRLDVEWRGILRDGSSYLRQQVAVKPVAGDLRASAVVMVDGAIPDAKTVGTVSGSPIVAGNFYLGVEHPMAENGVRDGRVRCALPVDVPVRRGRVLTANSVIGISPAGQMRRGFLYYVERERAHPYRPFLHYNSWYDIGYGKPYDEAAALNVVNAFGTELVRKRGVKMDSFLFDDGWDDPHTLWSFNAGFPDGFTRVRATAAKYGAAPGVWMSPWGGYGEARDERLKYGKAQGFETNADGFALSGPTYYRRFRDVCMQMMKRYGVNQFKFDGTGRRGSGQPNSPFGSDFEAMIHLIGELRTAKPDLYINLTTGTWPSPFWLRHADSIWRGGYDHSFAGVGTNRQQWITYRDADTYRHIVQGGPLFPVSSLMLHGIIYARQAEKLSSDPGNDFRSEVRDFFGSGTQLQEMYITPSLLSPENWDALAEAAAWSRRNADVLVDTHWIGGDPGKLEAYGWASWSPRQGILTLRNPSDKAQDITVDVADAFELPAGGARTYSARSPWREDRSMAPIVLRAGTPHTFHLEPFQVITLEATPTVG